MSHNPVHPLCSALCWLKRLKVVESQKPHAVEVMSSQEGRAETGREMKRSHTCKPLDYELETNGAPGASVLLICREKGMYSRGDQRKSLDLQTLQEEREIIICGSYLIKNTSLEYIFFACLQWGGMVSQSKLGHRSQQEGCLGGQPGQAHVPCTNYI